MDEGRREPKFWVLFAENLASKGFTPDQVAAIVDDAQHARERMRDGHDLLIAYRRIIEGDGPVDAKYRAFNAALEANPVWLRYLDQLRISVAEPWQSDLRCDIHIKVEPH